MTRIKTSKKKDVSSFKSEGDLNVSTRRKRWLKEQVDQKTKTLLEKDSKYFLRQSLSTPCLNVLKGCEGIYLEDLQGRRFMDFHGNNVHQVGFGHPRVIAAIKAQLEELPFCPRRYTNEPAVRLAEKLAQLAPGNLNKVLFAPGGTSAIGMAIKLARAATGRFKTISMWDSFHGASLDAISIGGEAIFRQNIGPLMPGTEHVPPADPLHCPFACGTQCSLQCARYIEYVLEKEGDVAAVIAETVRSTPYIPPPDYWKTIRAACDRHGTLLVLDEIPHCLGRTGKMFTCEHYDVVPDMLVIGKGLGGGVFPLAALIAREDLDVMPEKALGHYTHEKNPVACAAGLAAIECIESEGLLQNARVLGEKSLARIASMAKQHPLIGGGRGLGLLLGIELIKNQKTRERASDAAENVMYGSLERGLSFKVSMGNILTLTPPLIISDAEMSRALDIIEECLSTLRAS
jgi:4-aminobutyrate aminotransferase